jgi:hypothetical protein
MDFIQRQHDSVSSIYIWSEELQSFGQWEKWSQDGGHWRPIALKVVNSFLYHFPKLNPVFLRKRSVRWRQNDISSKLFSSKSVQKQTWSRVRLGLGLESAFGIGLVSVKPLLCHVLSLSGQRNNLFLFLTDCIAKQVISSQNHWHCCYSLNRCQNTKFWHTPCQLRANRADKNNRKGLGLTSNHGCDVSSSIPDILASLFRLEFSAPDIYRSI